MFPQVRRVSPLALGISVAAGLCTVLALSEARGQTAEEHASHHPDQAAPAAQTGASPGAKPAGLMEGMAEMMKGMGAPPPKDFYPSLMALPELPPEQRKKIEDEASGRMHAGSALMGQALDKLNAGTQSDDYAAMQDAASRLREGITQLESGIAARRALAEGKPPREVALTWFKREMNLSLGTEPAPHGLFGPSVFHLLTMALLIAFALAMLALYFFKMRRAAAIVGRYANRRLTGTVRRRQNSELRAKRKSTTASRKVSGAHSTTGSVFCGRFEREPSRAFDGEMAWPASRGKHHARNALGPNLPSPLARRRHSAVYICARTVS